MKNLSRFMVAFAAAAVLFLSGCQSNEVTFKVMRERMARGSVATPEDMKVPSIAMQVIETDTKVADYLATMNKSEDRTYLWDDPSCTDSEFSPWAPWSVSGPFTRLFVMSSAYKCPASRYYNDADLLSDILSAVDWMCSDKWNTSIPIRGNWWEWIIGIPLYVNKLTAILYDELGPERRRTIATTLDYYAPDCEYPGASTGANKIWQCSLMIERGILEENPDKIAVGIDGLATELHFVESGDGFYEDGSFIQHGAVPYNGGYGISFIHHFANMTLVLTGSEYQLPQEYVRFLEQLVTEAYMPLVYNGSIMDMSRGREVGRCGDQVMGKRLLSYLYPVSGAFRPSLRDSIRAMIKHDMIDMGDESDPDIRAALSRLNDVEIPYQVSSEIAAAVADSRISSLERDPFYKQYQMMDRAVYNAGGFAVGLAMSSSRVQNYETLGGENMAAWHTSDGMTYIYNGDRLQYDDNYWYTVDNYRLPGITVDVDQEHPIESALFNNGKLYVEGYRSPYSWAGGAALSDCGISGMHFKDEHSTLEARKSWLFAGDVMVAFGAGISSKDGREIATIVDNRKLTGGGSYTLHLNGGAADILDSDHRITPENMAWACLESPIEGASVEYIFLDDSKIEFKRETRTGSSAMSSLRGDSTMHTRTFLTTSIQHGKNPENATYCYAVMPSVKATQASGRPDIRTLINTAAVQGVTIGNEGVTGINFWEGASFSSEAFAASSSSAASVIMRRKGNAIEIAVSDPTQLQTAPIRIELGVSAEKTVETDDAIKVVSLSPLVIEFTPDGAMGSSHTVKLLDK